ncbi:MAG: hypothetical protein WCT40_01855 [Candidatus Magasanikbacteria bacterium]|jgi:hypothetical protein
MKPSSKILLFVILIVGLLSMIGSSVAVAAFNPLTSTGLSDAQSAAELPTTLGPGKAATFPQLIGEAIGIGLSLVGMLFFLLMLYGGLYWMIARGDSSKVDKAKDTIEAAVIGLVIVSGAYAIANFIFSSIVGQ